MNEYTKFIDNVEHLKSFKNIFEAKNLKFNDSYYLAFQHLNVWMSNIMKQMLNDMEKAKKNGQ